MASELLPTNVANISKHESCYPLLLKSILFGVVLAPLAMTNSPAFSALATDSDSESLQSFSDELSSEASQSSARTPT